ncbi:LemA family protein [Psychroserpens sp. NJDZ02]|uniref:LemA family protein n=1 Tax=Psychroserpens sp. NJDZ02 TaxID=2570561 RepID=UPI0010A8F839|nr:LemA family protein [Psychroserpens sp. NJDZ02]QCE42435.1 LemA family protein [Psychroserpens sp. NJDZ02]
MNQTIGIVIIVIIIASIISVFIKLYNRLVMLKFNVEKAFANIDVLLKQRADEIPNLINTVKEYVTHEKETLNRLTELRTKYLSSTNQNEKIELTNKMVSGSGKIMMVAENYPDLKASASFIKLQERVSQLEDHISDRREFFNECINMYNIGINEFPNMILSKPMGYTEKALLQITEAEKKYNGVTF